MALSLTPRGRFLDRLDLVAVETAIAEAERQSSGQIRVSVAGFFRGDLRRFAERAFRRLRMDQTALRNAVLILVVPARRKLTILGDEGIDRRVGAGFWLSEADALGRGLQVGNFTAALIACVRRVGQVLAVQFPADGEARINELPDVIRP